MQHRAQLRRDALRQEDRYPRADAQKLHVRDRAQTAQQMFQLLVAEQQRVAAAQQHVAHLRMAADVLDLPVELGMEIVAAGVAHQPRPRAIPAIRRAPVRHQEQHPVGITVHQARHRRMRVLAARVAHLPRRDVRFLDARDDLPANRAVLVGRVNEVEEVGRDGQRQLVIGQRRAGDFLRRQRRHQPLELLDGGNAVLELPVPVVPVRIRHIGPKTPPRRAELLESFRQATRWRLVAVL